MVEGLPAPVDMVGAVKWFDPNKGYGFIAVEGERDVFLHVKELRRCKIIALNDGDKLSFKAEKGPKGAYATDIKMLQGTSLKG